MLNMCTLVFLWDPMPPKFCSSAFLLPHKLQGFPQGARKMQLVSIHPPRATKSGVSLEVQNSWRGLWPGTLISERVFLKTVVRQTEKICKMILRRKFMCTREIAPEREGRSKDAGRAFSRAREKEDVGVRGEKNNLSGFIFGAVILKLESHDILSKLFWNGLSLQHCFYSAWKSGMVDGQRPFLSTVMFDHWPPGYWKVNERNSTSFYF